MGPRVDLDPLQNRKSLLMQWVKPRFSVCPTLSSNHSERSISDSRYFQFLQDYEARISIQHLIGLGPAGRHLICLPSTEKHQTLQKDYFPKKKNPSGIPSVNWSCGCQTLRQIRNVYTFQVTDMTTDHLLPYFSFNAAGGLNKIT